MKSKILVTYATKSGSTAEVAQAIGQKLAEGGAIVEVRPIKEVNHLNGYEAVIVGGPMIMGWHREAVKFVEQHRQALSRVPVAYFLIALRLTQTPASHVDGVPIYQDPGLAKPPQNGTKLSFKENYATVSNYLGPILQKVPQVKPVSAAFFGGKLDPTRLDLLSRLFVQVIIGARTGDYRHWPAINAWAAHLSPLLRGEAGGL